MQIAASEHAMLLNSFHNTKLRRLFNEISASLAVFKLLLNPLTTTCLPYMSLVPLFSHFRAKNQDEKNEW